MIGALLREGLAAIEAIMECVRTLHRSRNGVDNSGFGGYTEERPEER